MNRGICETCIYYYRVIGEWKNKESIKETCKPWQQKIGGFPDVGTVKKCSFYSVDVEAEAESNG